MTDFVTNDLLFRINERHENASWLLFDFLVNTADFKKHVNQAIEFGLHREIVHPDLSQFYLDILLQSDNETINLMRISEKTREVVEGLRERFVRSDVSDIQEAVNDILYFKTSLEMVQAWDKDADSLVRPVEGAQLLLATRLSDIANTTQGASTYRNDARQIVRQIREESELKKRPVRLKLGLNEYDQFMRMGIGTIVGLNAGYKRGKTRVALNCVVNNLYLAKREKVAMDDLASLGEHVLTMSNDEIRKELNIDNRHWIAQARSLYETGEQYQEWGIGILALEKSKKVTLKEIACMMAVDLIKDGRRIYRAINALNDDDWWNLYYPYPFEQRTIHTGWANRPRYDEFSGYYFTPDKHLSKCFASNISIDLLEDIEGGKMEEFWGLRKVAYDLAMDDLENRYGEMLRIYDNTEDGGLVGNSDDLERVIRREQVVYPRFPTALWLIDYWQAMWAKGAHTEQEALTLNARKMPNMAGYFGFCVLATIQQNNLGIEQSKKGEAMMLDVSPRGGTVVTAALENYCNILGPFKPSPDGKSTVYDPRHIYWQISGGRRGEADDSIYRVPVHGPTGRKLKPAFDRDGHLVVSVDEFNLDFKAMPRF